MRVKGRGSGGYQTCQGKGSGGILPGRKGKGAGGFQNGVFQGECWKSGEKGHRSFECPKRVLIQGVDSGWVEPPT
eukprot:12362271-Karenia_brevis.AAC.1